MRVLITGGAGFIGSAVARVACARGDDVVVLDDLSSGARDVVPGGARLVEASVHDRSAIHRHVAWAERVFHLAGTGDRTALPSSLLSDLAGTETVLDTCARFGRAVLVPSTGEVHGPSSPIAKETGPVALPPPSSGTSCFAAARLLVERIALAHHARSGLPVVVARLFDLAGHVDDAARILADLMDAAPFGRIVDVVRVRGIDRILVDLVRSAKACGDGGPSKQSSA